MNDRRCLKCQEPLRGRADQKFCNYQCRSAYNNQQYVESNNVIRTINRILKKNYFILTALNSEGKTTTSKIDLQKKGYRFDYFTCSYPTRNSKINYFCYDQGYREQENNKIILVRRDLKGDLTGPRVIIPPTNL